MRTQDAVVSAIRAAGSIEKLAILLEVSFHAVYAWSVGRRTPGRLRKAKLAQVARERGWSAEIVAAMEQDDEPTSEVTL